MEDRNLSKIGQNTVSLIILLTYLAPSTSGSAVTRSAVFKHGQLNSNG